MLFYLGYLTIVEEKADYPVLKVPNKVMKEIYSDYFLKTINKNIHNLNELYSSIALEIRLEGKINKLIELAQKYLSNLSNRDYIKFEEKHIKLILYCILMNLDNFMVKSETEVNKRYPDLLILPIDISKGYKSIMIELKYLKKGEENKIKEKQKEAKEQIQEYMQLDDIKNIPDLKCYTVVAVNDEIYVEKIEE